MAQSNFKSRLLEILNNIDNDKIIKLRVLAEDLVLIIEGAIQELEEGVEVKTVIQRMKNEKESSIKEWLKNDKIK